MKRYRSEAPSRRAGRSVLSLSLLAIGAAIIPIVASVVTTDLFIVREEDPIDEDVYVVSTSGRVEGLIDGDLVIFTGDLTISGTVTGSVFAATSGTLRVTEDGVIEGALRALSPEVVISGRVGTDVASTALRTSVSETGVVGRDVIAFGGTVGVGGTVGRDLRGRMLNLGVAGTVGRDVDVTVERLVIEADATVGGDVLYRSARGASIAADADISGQVVHLPTQANFIFGVILTIANVVGFLAFVVVGILVLWLFRGTSARAVTAVIRRPVRSLLIGVATVIAVPVLIAVFAVSLVGLPISLALIVGSVLAFVVGPLPAVTALGERILRSRGGLFGALLVGAVLWRGAIWLIPLVGALVYVLAFVWGIGAWVVGAWDQRSAGEDGPGLLPPAMQVAPEDELEGWEPPLPPASPEPGPEA